LLPISFLRIVVRHLVAAGRPVLAVDADINQHLGAALGHDGPPPRALGTDLTWLKDHLRAANPRISSAEQMIKTTPPGTGSRLLDLAPDGELLLRYSAVAGGVRYLVTGEFDEADVGVSCYHSKTGAVELYLNHLVDGPGEYVVVDMTAGADAFASGLFTRFVRDRVGPRVTHQLPRQGFADERHQQPEQLDHDRGSRLTALGRTWLTPGRVESLQRPVRPDLHRLEPGHFRRGEYQGPRHE